jgi:hypothetical protein
VGRWVWGSSRCSKQHDLDDDADANVWVCDGTKVLHCGKWVVCTARLIVTDVMRIFARYEFGRRGCSSAMMSRLYVSWADSVTLRYIGIWSCLRKTLQPMWYIAELSLTKQGQAMFEQRGFI